MYPVHSSVESFEVLLLMGRRFLFPAPEWVSGSADAGRGTAVGVEAEAREAV
jgi:hypothetical protein